MRPMVRGVILEGLSHSGKTSTLNALKRIHTLEEENAERSLIVLGEHYSQILNNENGRYVRLNRDEHLSLLKERVGMIEQLNEWACKLGEWGRVSRGLFFVFERFHLNHRHGFPEYDTGEIRKLEERLCELGAKTVLLTVSPEIVEERIQQRSPGEWTGFTKDQIREEAEKYIEMQEKLLLCSRESIVPTIHINTDNLNWDGYARSILESFSIE